MAAREVLNDQLLTGNQTYQSLDNTIGSMVLDGRRHKKNWYVMLGIAFLLLNGVRLSVGWLLYQGVGVWGNNVPTAWAFDIINFVWWIGIGHAGTLISAILLLVRGNSVRKPTSRRCIQAARLWPRT